MVEILVSPRIRMSHRPPPSASFNLISIDLLTGVFPSQQTEAQIFVETEVLESKDVEDSTSGSDQEPEDESRFLHGWSLTTLMTALMAAVFMVALDSSIIGRYCAKSEHTFTNTRSQRRQYHASHRNLAASTTLLGMAALTC
jgi:hypothetical protein